MKKIVALLLAAVMVLALCACGSTTTAPAATAVPAAEAPAAAAAVAEPEVDDQLSAIQKAGKLVVGVEGTYYPYTYHDEATNELDGYDIQIAKGLAEYLGVEVEFVEAEWDSLLAGVDAGRLDTVINDVTATAERREKYLFSDPYFFSYRQFVVKTGNEVGLHTVDDLNGKKIATNATNSLVPLLEQWGVEIVNISDTDECATMVQSGRVDFCMFSAVVLKEYMEQHPEAELEVAFVLENSINEIAIPTRLGEERLMSEINAYLQSIRDNGTLLELSMKYFDADYCTDPRTAAAAEEEDVDDQLAAIKAAGKIVVGVEGTYYPYTYHDEVTDELDGYDIQVAKLLAEYLGVEVEFVEAEWDSLLAGVDSGRLDTVINDVTATAERREKYLFSDPYFFSFRQFVVKTGNAVGLHTVDDIKGKKIATNATNSLVPLLEEWGAEIVNISDTDECATMVQTGRVDFCMFSAPVMKEYMKQHPEAQLEVAFVLEDSVNEIAIPTRLGEERLMNQINAFLQSIRDDGTLLELSMKYFEADYCTDPRT